MGKAGQALRQVLEAYKISQNRLAVTMGVGRSTVHYWFSGTQDPSAEAVTQIVEALQTIDRSAAKEFVRLYLGEIVLDDAVESNADLTDHPPQS